MKTALALLLACACATPWQPHEGHLVLKEIKFEGNKTIGGGDLLQKIATAPTSGFFGKTARYYDPDLFAIDLKRLVRWYNEKGFYEAKIVKVDEQKDDKGRVTLLVQIDEGRRAYVKKMDFEGLENLPQGELSDVNDALPIHPGDPFDEDGYEKAKDVLEQQLKEHGFAEAEVTGRVEVMPEDGSARIVWSTDLGQRFHFGKVIVSGNRAISSNEIELATGIHRGDSYSPSALALAQQRVYNLGAFSGVRVSLEPLGDTPVAAVRVNVREAPFQTVRFGVGAQAEDTRWELPRLRGEYTNRSFLGGLRRLELSSTVGYAFVPSPFPGDFDSARSGITTEDSAQLTIPNVVLPGLDFVTRGEFDREVQSGYTYDEVAARFSLLYRRGQHSISPSLNFVRFFRVNLPGSELYTAITRGGGGIFTDCPSSCTLTYPEIRYTFDARDNAIEPTQGFYFSTGIQQTLKPGSFSYFRLEPDLRAYAPVTKYLVFAARVHYGALITEGADVSPFTQRFFFGGQTDQRGYAPQRQGPKIGAQTLQPCPAPPAQCTPSYATVGVPIGGKSALLLSGEVRIHADWLLNHLGFVPFVDISQVGDDWKNPAGATDWRSAGFEVSPGFGVRYLTPFGPIRFDIAWVVNPHDVLTQASPDVLQTRVSVHCNSGDQTCIHESRYAFHLTLGEAF